jgi:hypothetical protein
MVTTVGSEIVVNAASDTGELGQAQVDALSSGGGFVVTWTDQNTSDVSIQRFDSSGNKVPSETSFGPAGGSAQVAGLAGGGFAVSWSDLSNVANTQLYNSSGNASGSPITVAAANAFVSGNELAALTGGGFVDVWSSADSSQVVSGEAFSATGTADPVGVFSLSNAEAPVVAGLSGGGFVVAAFDPTGSVIARLYDSHGTPSSSQFTVSTLTYIHTLAAAPLANGDFVVLWEQNGEHAQRYDSSGTAVGPALTVDSSLDDTSVEARLLGDGRFVVVWDRVGASTDSIYGQIYNSDGTKSGGQFTVTTNASTIDQNAGPQVAALGSNEFVVTWSDPGASKRDRR